MLAGTYWHVSGFRILENKINIHKKVMFDTTEKLDVKYDYTTCHNNILKKCNKYKSKKI